MKKKKLIIDASCIVAVLKQEDTAGEVLAKINGYELVSAACLPYEIGNSLSKLIKRNLIDADDAVSFFNLFSKLPVSLIDVDFENSLRFSGEEKQYAYDMYYLDCAVRTGCPLLTFDEGLISIAKKRGVVCL